jgi:hypothetical protein
MRTKIYALRENGFVRYVGKTTHSLENRLGAHLQDARKGVKSYKCNWIRSLFRKGLAPTITTLEEVEGNGSKAEQEWIAYFKGYGIKLTNGTAGGDGGDTFILKSDLEKQEFRKRMAVITKGRVVSLETRKQTSTTLMGHKPHHTPEGNLKISRALTGRKKPPRSAKHCLHLSIAKQGSTWKQETYRKVHQAWMNKRSYKVTYCEECGKPIRQLVQSGKRFCNTSCSATWRMKQPKVRNRMFWSKEKTIERFNPRRDEQGAIIQLQASA